MKRIVKKISTIALTVIAMLTVFTVHPSSIASESFSTTMVYAEPEEVKVEDKDKGSGSSSSGSSGSTEGDTAFNNIVNFFATWIGRIGLLVAFVGSIMFGLAIKNNDAEQKQNGLLTLASGFVVAALCKSLDLFGL
jgi:hypothetical protein